MEILLVIKGGRHSSAAAEARLQHPSSVRKSSIMIFAVHCAETEMLLAIVYEIRVE
jgi:hypothetical protein